MLNADGTLVSEGASLTTHLKESSDSSSGAAAFCPLAVYRSSIVTSPVNGTLEPFDEDTSVFYYTTTSPTIGTNIDAFTFRITCFDSNTTCEGTATISIVESNDTSIYYAHDNSIICRGTCDAGAWRYDSSLSSSTVAFFETSAESAMTARQDGREIDGMDFNITVDGKLLIYAYTTIGNLAARFVTFSPLPVTTESTYLTSASAPDTSLLSFQTSCLNEQATTGVASDIWTWTNATALQGHLNTITNNYKSGDNYYQKFGGNHRNCDVYRTNPCKYAPLLTPSLHNSTTEKANHGAPFIEWKLYINGCDATWVGTTSVVSLQALRQPDGSPTFALEEGGRFLVGKVYSQSVKPVSWTSPSAGISHSERVYDLRLKIHSTIVVEAVANTSKSTTVASGSSDAIQMGSDIQYTIGVDRSTTERLYAYSILLYPYTVVNNEEVPQSIASFTVTSVSLRNSTWIWPAKEDCQQCTGTRYSCFGTGEFYQTDCGSDALITFGPILYNETEFGDWGDSMTANDLFSSTALNAANALRVTFAARVNGEGTANATDGYPVGTFAIAVSISTGQTFDVVVNQTNYISEINTQNMNATLYRTSAYWPVADPLGTSVAVLPYNATPLAFPEESSTGAAVSYDGPRALTSEDICGIAAQNIETHVQLDSWKGLISNGTAMRNVSMIAVEDERTYGVTDWVMVSLPIAATEETQVNGSVTYTEASLNYVTLTVGTAEVASSLLQDVSTHGYINILLDGTAPKGQLTEEETWMNLNSSSNDTYYSWQSHASSLNYRRITAPYSNNTSSSATKPFNFAFVPGSLLHSSSSVRLSMYITASIKFKSYIRTTASETKAEQIVSMGEKEGKLLYIISVSRGISSAIRFGADTYTPQISKSGLSQSSATVLFIILVVAVICVLAVSVYIEVTYKQKIHNAKYYPKRPESAVGIRYGRDGKPKDNQKTSKEGSRAGKSSVTARQRAEGEVAATTTKFGTIGAEQIRVAESVGSPSVSSSDVANAAEPHTPVHPPIGDEQARVEDNEVAEL